MNKKNVIIWANCQGGTIHYMLEKYYSSQFKVSTFMNFEYIKNDKLLPSDFYEADIFIYQNYSDKPNSEYDLTNILNNILPKSCIKICISFLQFDATFCYNENDIQNTKTINSENPFGKFCYGIELIINYFKDRENSTKEDSINVLTNLLLDENALSEEKILYNYNRSFEYLEKNY